MVGRGSSCASRPRLAALLSALLASGCVPTISSTYRDPRTFEPRKTEDVLVLTERPTRPHVVIASLNAEAEGRMYSRDELVATLRREAARLGGDALLVYAEANTFQFVSAGILVGTASTTRERHVLADVVVFADPGLAPKKPGPGTRRP